MIYISQPDVQNEHLDVKYGHDVILLYEMDLNGENRIMEQME